jgi:hypothetical protein
LNSDIFHAQKMNNSCASGELKYYKKYICRAIKPTLADMPHLCESAADKQTFAQDLWQNVALDKQLIDGKLRPTDIWSGQDMPGADLWPLVGDEAARRIEETGNRGPVIAYIDEPWGCLYDKNAWPIGLRPVIIVDYRTWLEQSEFNMYLRAFGAPRPQSHAEHTALLQNKALFLQDKTCAEVYYPRRWTLWRYLQGQCIKKIGLLS